MTIFREKSESKELTGDISKGHIKELIKIGLALSSEKKLECLLDMIVSEARCFTNAEAGSLYVKSDDGRCLDFAVVQNEILGLEFFTRTEGMWDSVELFLADGQKNHNHVSAHCAHSGRPVNIPDVYACEGFDFVGTREFDAATGYRSRSMLVIPMRDHEDEVIGVLQLLNAKDRGSGEIVPFPEYEVEYVTCLASQAGIALTNMKLIRGLETLLNSFMQSIAAAIDAKSPHTAGHIARVADLTEALATAISESDASPFQHVRFTGEELAEIKMAAWMHDVGKIITPEHIIDKSTKLEGISDRLEIIRYRLEILLREKEIDRLRRQNKKYNRNESGEGEQNGIAFEEAYGLLQAINSGGRLPDEETCGRLKELAAVSVPLAIGRQKKVPLISDEELKNLFIARGTLNQSERKVIQNHVNTTIDMLTNLPFPRKLNNVPSFAGMHHETLDGKGYPKGLEEADLPLQARILAIADIFEALTAADRPYKKGKLLGESMGILEDMVAAGRLDGDICNLAVSSGVFQKYAANVLGEKQLEDFYWRGEKIPMIRKSRCHKKAVQGV